MLELVNKLGPQRIAAMGAVTLALIGFFAFIMLRVSSPAMSVLFTDLASQDSAAIMRDLEGRGVPFELRQEGGTILVPKDQALRLRMDFAGKGMPAGGGVGYEVFDKSDAFSASSFVQNINQLRALEGELVRTIRSLDRVQNARVHLAIPERRLFQRDRENPRASIVLKVRGDLDAGQIRAIRHLVATAVEGLKPEHVSIVDEGGRLLADGTGNANDLAVAGAEKQAAYERRVQGQIEEIVANIVGRGRARVQVAAEMDFNRIQETSDSYDPDGRVVRSTQTRNENQLSAEARDGQVTVGNELPAANQQQQQGQQGPQNPVTRDTTQKNEEIINYEISRKTRVETIEAGRVKKLSVAVLVDGAYARGANNEVAYQPRAPEELERIAALVRSAIGFDRARGDQVEVVNLRFADAPPITDFKEVSLMEQVLAFGKDDVLRMVELGVFALLTLMVLLMVVRPLLRQIREPSAEGLVAAGAGGVRTVVGPNGEMLALPAPGAAPLTAEQQAAQFEQIAAQLPPGHISKLGEMVQKSPGESVAIIRSWLNNPR